MRRVYAPALIDLRKGEVQTLNLLALKAVALPSNSVALTLASAAAGAGAGLAIARRVTDAAVG